MAAAAVVGLADSPSLAQTNLTFTELNVANTAQEPGFACATGSSRPYLRTLTPTLRGRVIDPNNKTISDIWFIWQKLDPTTHIFSDAGSAHLDAVPSNSIAQITATGLTDGGIYNFRLQDHDARLSDPAGEGYCEFGIDTVAPNPPSSVTSTLYPDDGSFHGSVGKTGDFRISPPTTAADDVKSYVYALTPFTGPPTDGTRTIPTGADDGATIQVNPTMSGLNDLRVWSVDKAGNMSPLASPVVYEFRVGDPAGPLAAWTADEPAGATTLTDQSSKGNDAAASNVAFGVPSRIMGGPTAARFNGVDSYAATSGPVVDTSRSFTVAAWLRLDSTSNPQTAISFAGNHQSSFNLYYDNNTNQWGFSATPADEPTTNPNNTTVLSTSQATTNEWTHLTASYDSATKQLRLYVNGQLSGTTTYSTSWTATAPVQIGRHFHNDTYSNYWNGDLDELRVYDRIISDKEIAKLAAATLSVSWTFDERAGDTAFDKTGRYDATLAGGATFTNSGHNQQNTGDPGSIHFDGVDGYAATTGPVVDTGRSFTIAAWLRLESASNSQTAISFAGNHQSSFNLYYDNNTNQWGFSATPADEPTTNPNNTTVLSTSQATTNRWTHLTASYDSATKQLRLYVNGQLSGTTTIATTTWTATAPVQIGRHFHNDSYTNYWNGDLDNIRVYQGILSPDKITSLAIS